MGDGEIEQTFRWTEQLSGAHAGNGDYNNHGIGIALVGNFDERSPSPDQMAAIKRLVGVLKARYGISSANVVGHNDVKATACPGKHFPLVEVGSSLAGPSVSGRAPARNRLQLVSSQRG